MKWNDKEAFLSKTRNFWQKSHHCSIISNGFWTIPRKNIFGMIKNKTWKPLIRSLFNWILHFSRLQVHTILQKYFPNVEDCRNKKMHFSKIFLPRGIYEIPRISNFKSETHKKAFRLASYLSIRSLNRSPRLSSDLLLPCLPIWSFQWSKSHRKRTKRLEIAVDPCRLSLSLSRPQHTLLCHALRAFLSLFPLFRPKRHLANSAYWFRPGLCKSTQNSKTCQPFLKLSPEIQIIDAYLCLIVSPPAQPTNTTCFSLARCKYYLRKS